ncbi:MAG: DeoR/GlpR family DNA-binding transcription regulator [Acidobacteriia bacterium]|nr:DeoR/GlpR family DNA-binding transcription regulator [Terriglobia bacterium]
MLAEERKLRIREILSEQRTITAAELKQSLGVTAATVRRDLVALESEGVLVRSHGGAVSRTPSTSFQPSYDALTQTNLPEKKAIAREAERLILEGETVFLESSTTVHELAKLLHRRTRLTIITNSPATLSQVQYGPGVTVLCVGGNLIKENCYLSGMWAHRILQEIRVDKVILGLSGLDPDYGISTANHPEAEIKRLLMKISKTRIALADSSKFPKQAFAYVGPISDLTMLITDAGADPESVKQIRQAGVEVKIAQKSHLPERAILHER